MTQVVTRSVDQTRSLGAAIGTVVDRRAVIALTGDLGCGKTTFVQGLARGLGVSEREYVTSPTFTLINEYDARLALVHVDLYRLDTGLDMLDIGFDEVLERDAVVAIEWADKLPPDELLTDARIHFQILGGHLRQLTFSPAEHRFSDTVAKWDQKQTGDRSSQHRHHDDHAR